MNTPAISITAVRQKRQPKYLALTLIALQQALADRRHTLLMLLSHLIWVVVLYYLWKTVFTAKPQVAGFDWDQMRTYILLAYAVNSLLAFSSIMRMQRTIRTGDVVQELLRPLDYMQTQLAYALGAALVEGGLSALLTLAFGALIVGMLPPVSLAAALLFLLSIALGFLIKFLISFLVSLLCFWTLNSLGLIWAQTAIVNLFSGALVPLGFFPGWFQTLAYWGPFQGIIYAPLVIYLGQVTGPALWQTLALQVGWIAALWTLARILWWPAARALEIQRG